MKILVAIANYGTANDQHLAVLLDQYRAMPHQVDVVVLSNIPKNLGSDIRVQVGLPTTDPWSLPFGHKRLFAEQAENYDLFIYSEDDVLITERNIEAFLRVTQVLKDGEIAGFFRYETDRQGSRHFCDASTHWHWDPESVRSRGECTFAFFTNEHAACYVLTRQQLRSAIVSGGFLVEPHREKYALAETAATDPYTQCGFKKLICISHLDDFLIHHLPNKYVGSLSLEETDFRRQVNALLEVQNGARPRVGLLGPDAGLVASKWAKSYYEPVRHDLLALVPDHTRSVLSIGCGWGATEGVLIKKGIRVVGVPLDSVIAACAEARGVETVCGDFVAVQSQLRGREFDCILVSNLLHLMAVPVETLSSLARFLSKQGVLVASVPNFAQLPVLWERFRHLREFTNHGTNEKMGVHLTTHRIVRQWMQRCGLNIENVVNVVPQRAQFADRFSLGFGQRLLASQIIAVAGNPRTTADRTT